jgi:FkbM family methyltransferase
MNKRINKFKHRPDVSDDLVKNFFSGKKQGIYVDVGANHPQIDSQSYQLEKLGFQGLLIEPLPSYCRQLEKERTGLVIQAACSNIQNDGKYIDLVEAGVHSTLEHQPIAVGIKAGKKTSVLCMTLDHILKINNIKPGFEFLSIDIEGHEIEMFKGFSIEIWRPQLIMLEDHVTNHKKHNHMTKNNYQLIMRTGLNSWYVPRSENYTLSLLSKLEFFRKYWLAMPLRKLRYAK